MTSFILYLAVWGPRQLVERHFGRIRHLVELDNWSTVHSLVEMDSWSNLFFHRNVSKNLSKTGRKYQTFIKKKTANSLFRILDGASFGASCVLEAASLILAIECHRMLHVPTVIIPLHPSTPPK